MSQAMSRRKVSSVCAVVQIYQTKRLWRHTSIISLCYSLLYRYRNTSTRLASLLRTYNLDTVLLKRTTHCLSPRRFMRVSPSVSYTGSLQVQSAETDPLTKKHSVDLNLLTISFPSLILESTFRHTLAMGIGTQVFLYYLSPS